MLIPDDIVEQKISLQDQYFDLKGLSTYSALGVGTLRDYITQKKMPCFKIGGKVLVRRSEFDRWVEGYRLNRAQDIDTLVDGIMSDLKA